jgi:carboxylate-amine ligase
MTTIDLDRAAAAYAASTDFTVGIEEEFALLDPRTLDLIPRFEELSEAARVVDPLLAERIAGELISSEIEIRSGRGEDLADALSRQAACRRRLLDLAAARGVELSDARVARAVAAGRGAELRERIERG